MGRWAQRSRSGGGGRPINVMIRAVPSGDQFLIITWAGPVGLTTFDVPSFITNEGTTDTGASAPAGPNQLLIGFADDISSATSVTYTGHALGFQPGQVITIS